MSSREPTSRGFHTPIPHSPMSRSAISCLIFPIPMSHSPFSRIYLIPPFLHTSIPPCPTQILTSVNWGCTTALPTQSASIQLAASGACVCLATPEMGSPAWVRNSTETLVVSVTLTVPQILMSVRGNWMTVHRLLCVSTPMAASVASALQVSLGTGSCVKVRFPCGQNSKLSYFHTFILPYHPRVLL